MNDIEEGYSDGQHYFQNGLLLSIAINLKRIADSLEQPKVSGPIVNVKLTEDMLKSMREDWNKGN